MSESPPSERSQQIEKCEERQAWGTPDCIKIIDSYFLLLLPSAYLPLYLSLQAKVDAPPYNGMQLCIKGSAMKLKAGSTSTSTATAPKQLLQKLRTLNSNSSPLAYGACRKASMKATLQAPAAEIML